MSGSYPDIQSFVDALNQSGVPYLILRNYENMLSSEIYMEGHGDIDLLCADSRILAKAVGAMAYTNKVKEICDDGVHFYVMIANNPVSLDMRYVGDGYYCTKWEREMLERRVMKGRFYVMDDIDYVYSLIYHAILQKKFFSDEYRSRLTIMCKTQQIQLADNTPEGLIRLLEVYMKEHGYTYTYPFDTFVPLNTEYITPMLLEKNRYLAYRHWRFDTKVAIIEFLVSIKHLFMGSLR